jgi:hypothetical protein
MMTYLRPSGLHHNLKSQTDHPTARWEELSAAHLTTAREHSVLAHQMI